MTTSGVRLRQLTSYTEQISHQFTVESVCEEGLRWSTLFPVPRDRAFQTVPSESLFTMPPHLPQSSRALTPYPKAGTVRVGPNEAEAIARNILAPHSKSNDGGGVSG